MTSRPVSPEMAEAQTRLQQLRANLPPRPAAESNPPAEPLPPAESPPPASQGDNWELKNAKKLIADRQEQAGITPPPAIPPTPEPLSVVVYADIGTAAIHAGEAPIFRAWLLIGRLDEAGTGRISRAEVKQALTNKTSEFFLCGWRNLQEILKRGRGRYWYQEPGHMLRLAGREALAGALGVTDLHSKPMLLPVALISGKLSVFNAHVYICWRDGLNNDKPIARATQQAMMGIDERTQRRFDETAGLTPKANIAILAPYTKEGLQQFAAEYGHAVFLYKDLFARYGPKGQLYIARHLPNSYPKTHQRAANGRWRKVRRGLPLLVKHGVRGNGRTPHVDVPVRYQPNGTAAAKAYNRDPDRDVYIFRGKIRGYRLWQALPRRGRENLSFFGPHHEAFRRRIRGEGGAAKSFVPPGEKLRTHPQAVDNAVQESLPL